MFAIFLLNGSDPQLLLTSSSLEEALLLQDCLLEEMRRPGSPGYQRLLGLQSLFPQFTGYILVAKVPNVDSPQALIAALASGHPFIPITQHPILPLPLLEEHHADQFSRSFSC